MKENLIDCAKIAKNVNLPNYCKFCFGISASKDIYKEDLYEEIIQNVNKPDHDANVPDLIINYKDEDTNDFISFYKAWNKYSNVCQVEKMIMEDKCLYYEFSEFTDQSLIIPEIRYPLYLLLYILKAYQKKSSNFDGCTFSLFFSVYNNTSSYFDYRYSPMICDYNWLLKYELSNGKLLKSKIESVSDLYLVVRRFYELFKTSVKTDKPYVILDSNSFDKVYKSI